MTNKQHELPIRWLACWTLWFVLCAFQQGSVRVDGAAVEETHMDIICRNILKLHCHVFHDSLVTCGTDGVTYNNSKVCALCSCEFAQSHCKSAGLHVLHSGKCMSRREGLTAVLKLVCDDIAHVDCRNQPSVVLCASNGLTYDNNCLFEKARCQKYGLYVLHAGPC